MKVLIPRNENLNSCTACCGSLPFRRLLPMLRCLLLPVMVRRLLSILRCLLLPVMLCLVLTSCGIGEKPLSKEEELADIYERYEKQESFFLEAGTRTEEAVLSRPMLLQQLLPEEGALYLIAEKEGAGSEASEIGKKEEAGGEAPEFAKKKETDNEASEFAAEANSKTSGIAAEADSKTSGIAAEGREPSEIAAEAAGYVLAEESPHYRIYTCDSDVTVYVTRHGQTVANVTGLLAGAQIDSPLTEEGEEGVRALGQKLADIPFENAYVSTLGRTQKTARLALSENKSWPKEKVLLIRSGLDDISWGILEGMTQAEAVQAYGDISIPTIFGRYDDPYFTAPYHAESMHDYVSRFHAELMSLALDEDNRGGNILVTTHSAAGFWIAALFELEEIPELENASVSVFHFHHGKWNRE